MSRQDNASSGMNRTLPLMVGINAAVSITRTSLTLLSAVRVLAPCNIWCCAQVIGVQVLQYGLHIPRILAVSQDRVKSARDLDCHLFACCVVRSMRVTYTARSRLEANHAKHGFLLQALVHCPAYRPQLRLRLICLVTLFHICCHRVSERPVLYRICVLIILSVSVRASERVFASFKLQPYMRL